MTRTETSNTNQMELIHFRFFSTLFSSRLFTLSFLPPLFPCFTCLFFPHTLFNFKTIFNLFRIIRFNLSNVTFIPIPHPFSLLPFTYPSTGLHCTPLPCPNLLQDTKLPTIYIHIKQQGVGEGGNT